MAGTLLLVSSTASSFTSVIVLAVIFMQRLAVGGRQLIATEPSGPEIEKLTPRLRDSAVRVVTVYLALTLLLVSGLIILGRADLAPGMGFYEAVTHAFTTVSAGGFSPNPRSIEPYGPWAQWLILVAIVLAGTNLALWFRAIAQRRPGAFRDEELRWYLIILAFAAGLVSLEIIRGGLYELEDGIRNGAFNAASIMTGTGYASTDFAAWPQLALGTLFLLMFVGGCAGSPTGALKVVRLMLVSKTLKRETLGSIHPEQIHPIRIGGRVVGDRTVRSALTYVLLYVVLVIVASVALLLDPGAPLTLTYQDALSAIAATLGNVGPGFGFFGPMGSYEPFSGQAKALMALLMVVGRLEIFPILLLLTRAFWRA
jgi:trk system potassium uptake protein TrkH